MIITLILWMTQSFAESQVIPSDSNQENMPSDTKDETKKPLNDKEISPPLDLYLEACSGHLQAVQLFIEKGASVNHKNEDEKLPIHCASHKGYLPVVAELLKKMENVDARDYGGRTAFHYASHAGHLDILEMLLKKGANINATDHERRTPFHYASQGCNKNKIMAFLHNKKADKDILDKNGKSPADYHCNKEYNFFKP